MFQTCDSGESASFLVSKSISITHALVVNAQALPPQAFKESACGKYTSLHVRDVASCVCGDTSFRISRQYTKHALGENTHNFLSREGFHQALHVANL